KQLEPRFTRFLGDAARNDHDLRSGQIGIISCGHGERMRKRNRMINIVGFSCGAGAVNVHQHDFTAHAAHHERAGASRTDHSTPNQSDFHKLIISMRWWLSGSLAVGCWVRMAKSPGRLWWRTHSITKPSRDGLGRASYAGMTP